MTDKHLRNAVDKGITLRREIEALEGELKELKQSLVAEAHSRPDEQTNTDGGGRSWTATGSDGAIARVVIPAPSLKSKIDGEGKAIEKIKTLAGKWFEKLFRPAISYRPIHDFRAEAEVALGKSAGKLIKACESQSSPSVSFEIVENN